VRAIYGESNFVIASAASLGVGLVHRVLRYPLRLLPHDAVVPILSGPLRGQKWVLRSFLHQCWLGSYEAKLQKALAKEVKPGGVFYDIGANVGFHSLLAAKLIFPGRVYAFEPVIANLSYLRTHLQLNDVQNVEIVDIAVSDTCGRAAFVTEGSRAMGHLQSGGDTTVRTDTLDGLIQTNIIAPPDYIKMDIEGSELRALHGAERCLSRFRPMLFLATHGGDIYRSCCELLDSWCYDLEPHASSDQERAQLIARPRRQDRITQR
jgi:FkbM family methyltransferase